MLKKAKPRKIYVIFFCQLENREYPTAKISSQIRMFRCRSSLNIRLKKTHVPSHVPVLCAVYHFVSRKSAFIVYYNSCAIHTARGASSLVAIILRKACLGSYPIVRLRAKKHCRN